MNYELSEMKEMKEMSCAKRGKHYAGYSVNPLTCQLVYSLTEYIINKRP
jgi:hypothetical protein